MANYNPPTRLFNFNNLPPSEGLIAAWNLENTNDNFSTNNLTNNNAATFVAAKILNGVSLNGTTQYLSIADNVNISYGAGKKLSAVGWFKLDALPVAESPIISKWSAVGNREYIVRVLNTGALQFSISGDGTGIASVTSDAGRISALVFYFFAVWYDGVNLYLEINVDNNIYTTPYTFDIFNGNSELNIGRNQEDATFFDGIIDAVRLYKHDNRVITAPERRSLYNSGLGRQYVVNNVVSSDEVNRELDQLIELFSGLPTDITPKIVSAAQNAIVTVDQLGDAVIAQFYKNGTKVLEIKNDGQIKSYLATGTAPLLLTNASNGLIANLNVDLLDGLDVSAFLKTSSKIIYHDAVFFGGSLAALDERRIITTGRTMIGMYAKARVAASSDSVIKFTFEQYRGIGQSATITLPNNTQVAFLSLFDTPLDDDELYNIRVNTATGTTKPIDVTVGVITREAFV